MRGLAGKFALGMFLGPGLVITDGNDLAGGIDGIAGGGVGARRDPDQYFADFTDGLVWVGLVMFGNLIPVGPDSAAMRTIGIDLRGRRPGDITAEPIEQGLFSTQRLDEASSQIPINHVGGRQQPRDLTNFRVLVSKKVASDCSFDGIATADRGQGRREVRSLARCWWRPAVPFRLADGPGTRRADRVWAGCGIPKERPLGASTARTLRAPEYRAGGRRTRQRGTSGRGRRDAHRESTLTRRRGDRALRAPNRSGLPSSGRVRGRFARTPAILRSGEWPLWMSASAKRDRTTLGSVSTVVAARLFQSESEAWNTVSSCDALTRASERSA